MGSRVVIKAQNPDFQHSNWNGWMKSIHAEDAKQSTQVYFLPGDPNDYCTIFTTLKECTRISEDKACIGTFDLPIWLKAVEIIQQANLPIIPSHRY